MVYNIWPLLCFQIYKLSIYDIFKIQFYWVASPSRNQDLMDLTSMPPYVTSPNSMASKSGVHGSKLKGT